MSKNTLAKDDSQQDLRHKVGDAILGLVLQVPASSESQVARALGRTAARQASLMAGSLALPPGFLGWLTILPELLGVWRLQAQLVRNL